VQAGQTQIARQFANNANTHKYTRAEPSRKVASAACCLAYSSRKAVWTGLLLIIATERLLESAAPEKVNIPS